jgi:periplasmic protein TonB
MMKHSPSARHALGAFGAAGIAALLAACSSMPPPPDPPSAPPVAVAPSAAPAPAPQRRHSTAPNARAYRSDAAGHIYGLNGERVFKGRLPPMLYAVGVLQVEVDRDGHVQKLNWMRAPRHAPEVIAEIERTVRAASPFPAPVRMGRTVWTDTWLWDKSGRFQLDTLTEGQD